MTLHLALKIALAAALGLAVAQALDLPYPEYAVLAAATVTDVHAGPSAVLGVLRMVGSAVGIGLALLLVEVTGVSPWSVGFASLIAIGTCVLVHSAAAARLSIIVLGVGTLGIGDGVEAWAGDRLLTTGSRCRRHGDHQRRAVAESTDRRVPVPAATTALATPHRRTRVACGSAPVDPSRHRQRGMSDVTFRTRHSVSSSSWRARSRRCRAFATA